MRNKLRGFTILELLVVVAIIGILAVIALPSFIGKIEQSKESRELAELDAVEKAVSTYYMDNANYPTLQGKDGTLLQPQPIEGSPHNIDFSDLVPDYLATLPHFSYWWVDYQGKTYHTQKPIGAVASGVFTPTTGYSYTLNKGDGSKQDLSVSTYTLQAGESISGVDDKGRALPVVSAVFKNEKIHPESGEVAVEAPRLQLFIGTRSSYAVLPDGSVKAWGNNYYGQLGLGNTTNQSSPVKVTGLTGVKNIVSSDMHTLYLMSDGTVKGSGSNGNYQLGLVGTSIRATPVTIPNLIGVKQLACGIDYSVALMDDGSVKTWGAVGSSSQRGQLGRAGDAKVPLAVPSLSSVKQIASSYVSVYALLSDGTVKAWGYNGGYQLGVGTTADSYAPISIPTLTDIKEIVAADSFAYAIKTDGSVYVLGVYNPPYGVAQTPVLIGGLTGMKKLVAGYGHTLALMSDGTVKAWGTNSFGQLGLGTTSAYSSGTVLNLTDVQDIATLSRSLSSFVILKDGSVKAWGYNLEGQLGIGNLITQKSPVSVVIN